MRSVALGLALLLHLCPLHFGSGLILCIHPDGRGIVESAGDRCCRPCDTGGTHCASLPGPAGSNDACDSRFPDSHCVDIPLSARALLVRDVSRPVTGVCLSHKPGPVDAVAGASAGKALLSRVPAGDGRAPPPVALPLAIFHAVALRC